MLSSPAQVELPKPPHVAPAGSTSPDEGFVSGEPTAMGVGPVVPSAGSTVTLTRSNAMKRLGRLFKQRADGTFAVSEDLVKMWNTEDGKKELLEEYAKSGYNKDLLMGFQKNVNSRTYQAVPTVVPART